MFATLLTSVLPIAAPSTLLPAEPPSLASLSALPNLSVLQSESDSRRSTHSGLYIGFGGQAVTTLDSDGPGEDIDFDEGYALSALIGNRSPITDSGRLGFALELEAIFTDQDADEGDFFTAVSDVTTISGLLNGVFDFSVTENFGVYAGAGIGISFLDIGTESDGINTFDDEDGPFLSFQAKAGLLFRVSNVVGIDLGYRFFNIGDAELDDSDSDVDFKLETQQHMLGLGLRLDL